MLQAYLNLLTTTHPARILAELMPFANLIAAGLLILGPFTCPCGPFHPVSAKCPPWHCHYIIQAPNGSECGARGVANGKDGQVLRKLHKPHPKLAHKPRILAEA